MRFVITTLAFALLATTSALATPPPQDPTVPNREQGEDMRPCISVEKTMPILEDLADKILNTSELYGGYKYTPRERQLQKMKIITSTLARMIDADIYRFVVRDSQCRQGGAW